MALKRLRTTTLATGAVASVILSLARECGRSQFRRSAGRPSRVAGAPSSSGRRLHGRPHPGRRRGRGRRRVRRDHGPLRAVRSGSHRARHVGERGAFQAARSAAAGAARRLLAPGENSPTKPYNSDAVRYRDPFWSNSSGGAGLVSGRMTAIATDGRAVYAGAADGGVWKSTDKGAHWTPVFDKQSRLSVGADRDQPRRPLHLGRHRRGQHVGR